ncbi:MULTISPECIES: hypothetical protein [Moorena]|uniref:Uncharacterized protein n=1 Tax=Moorena producens (strain JHB) TaxID=1454205 RepID=A0A9Q9UWD9_MOOP1|nr:MULTISPECIES: hypothetical protein [Moorena]NEP32824.1 hypothetical protein [Moorena sp. SIO3B2]NER87100.1 hypothetical protein [Moorena sp. SIO3A2]WAN69751.1 hypothetical protein BJP36_37285 [Moorena producens JHB]
MIIFDAIFPTPYSLGALSVGELNSPRVAPLPTPYSLFPLLFTYTGFIDLLLYSAQNYSPNLPETIRE